MRQLIAYNGAWISSRNSVVPSGACIFASIQHREIRFWCRKSFKRQIVLMARPIWMACGEKPAIYEHRQSPIVMQKHQQEPRTSPIALCTNLWLLKTPFFARRPKHHPHSAAFRRRPDIAGPAIGLLLGTLRRTQEALAALRIRREAHFNPFSFNPCRPRTKGPDGFPSECIPQHEALSKRAKRAIIPPAVIHRRPDIAGSAISLLLGTLRRTQEALAARSAQRGLLACPRTCLKVN